jgi:GT2 family glycosyltransferase
MQVRYGLQSAWHYLTVTGASGPLQPIVDVVILSWNRLDLTLQSINSVRNQKEATPRVWIVDQGSEQDCLQALRDLSENDRAVSLHECGHNTGVAEGRNTGIALGSAECVVCLDNDAVLISETALAHAAASFSNDPKLAAIGFRIVDPETGDDELASWGYARSLLSRSDQPFVTTRYVGAGHALRRSAVEETNGYDKQLFFYWEELDLSYQLIDAGYRIVYDPTVIVEHRASLEMRAHWRSTRYYYYVRNAIYLDFKYFRSPFRVVVQVAGYLIKGIYNGLTRQASSGVIDALRMIRRAREQRNARLSEAALAYIREHDLRYRGGLLQRIRDEVLVQLPGLEREK